MKAILNAINDEGNPYRIATITIDQGKLVFDPPHMEGFISPSVMDASGPVPTTEPERYIKALPITFSGSMIRAEIIED